MTEAKDIIIGKKIYINGKHFCDIFEDDIITLRIKGNKKDLICRGKVYFLEEEYLLIDCSTNFHADRSCIDYKDILYICKEEDVDAKPIRLQETSSENI